MKRIRMTTLAGTFVFPEPTQLSHAKLIRDTITGRFFGNGLRTIEKARDLIVELDGSLRGIVFEWRPA